VAELGDGWQPIETDLQKLAEPIRKLKAARKARGRDPDGGEIRITLLPVKGANGRADLDASLARLPEYEAAGVTTVNFMPSFFTDDPKDFTRIVEKIERSVKG
jgi:alkanesulfonate monooxygenase SsuD/methylene tetrahydromethanopterin reductase-like flavin-dependent oxidoreductase (luciferase family)